ncbi:MAG: PAS domain S-box protein, partial [Saprospiraceae bacterium]|nr:PAS domain S-box protein [Saprospiraceae bacterium]
MMELKTVLDQVNDIIYTVNFDGIITFVNEKGLQSAPLAQESLIGYHFSVFVRSDYLPAVSGVFNQILQNGVVDSYFEFPLEFPGGQVIWLGQNTSIIERED